MDTVDKTISNYKFNTKEIEKLREEEIDKLLNNKIVASFVNKYNLNREFINSHLVEFIDMAKYDLVCLDCKGYNKCKNSPKGFIKVINLDTLNLEFSKCKYLDKLDGIINKYVIRDFDDDFIDIDFMTILNRPFNNAFKAKLAKVVGKESNKGIYLYGSASVGKTYCIAALTNTLVKTYNLKCAFVNFKKFLISLKENFGTDNDNSNERINVLKKIDILVLDDLGAEKATEWSTYEVLSEILEYRLHENKLTFITSRYNKDELGQLYFRNKILTKRLIDTINSITDSVELVGINYKNISKEGK